MVLQKKKNNNDEDMSKGGKYKFNLKDASVTPITQISYKRNRPDFDVTQANELTTRRYVSNALKLAKPHYRLLLFAFTCLFITSTAALIIPNSQGKILDKIVALNKQAFLYQVKFYLVLSVIKGFFGAVRNLCFRVVGRKIQVSVRSTMFRAIIVQDIGFFDGMSTGELNSRLSNDVYGMVNPIQTMLQTTLSNILALIGGLIMCFVTSWRLSMLAFTTIAPVVFLTSQYAKWSQHINREIWAAFGEASSVAQQAFANIRTVRAFGCEYKEIRQYDAALKDILQRGIIDAIASTTTFTLTDYLDLGASVMILWFGGLTIFDIEHGRLLGSDLTIGKLITFQLYWNMINSAYQGLQDVLTSFTRSAGAAQRILTLLDNLPEIDLNSGIDPGSLDGHIAIENLHFHYALRPDQQVLKGINLTVLPGEVVALVGRSGGGKSTLIHLLMRFYDPTQGAIYYNKNKIDLKTINLTRLRYNIGLVAQDTQLFDCTIEENIVYGLEEGQQYTKEELQHICQLANCHEFIQGFEDGYGTRVGERGVRLSGGQKQRIAIARMLMKRPKVLLLDEATSNLDTESEALVQAAIDKTIWKSKHTTNNFNNSDDNDNDNEKKINNNIITSNNIVNTHEACAVILVAHRLSTVMNADKIAVIDKGVIVELGSHKELLQIPNGVYAKLVSRQLQREQNQLKQDEAPNDTSTTVSTTNKNNSNKEGGKKDKDKKDKKNVPIDSIDSLFDEDN